MKENNTRKILTTQGLNLFVPPTECSLFVKKPEYVREIQLEAYKELEKAAKDGMKANSTEIEIRKEQTQRLIDVYSKYDEKIDKDKLYLVTAGMAKDFLNQLYNAETEKEFYDTQIALSDGRIGIVKHEPSSPFGMIAFTLRPPNETEEITNLTQDLSEGVLITNKYFSEKKNLKYNPTVKIPNYVPLMSRSLQARNLTSSYRGIGEFLKAPEFIYSLTDEKISEFYDKKLLSKSLIMKKLSRYPDLGKNMAVKLMVNGTLTEGDVCKIFNVSNIKSAYRDEELDVRSKLILYSSGKIDIDTLQDLTREYQGQNYDFSEYFKGLGKFYQNDVTKISELLVHDVLDTTNTVKFLDMLEEEQAITNEQRKYIAGLVSEFKLDEIVNNSDTEKITSGSGIKRKHYIPSLTIDPEERIKYLQSIGTIKKLKIRGETLVKDESEEEQNQSGAEKRIKKNSLDGYELFLIPDKKMAVLEKSYETTRDKKGKVIYKKDENGNLIPALENATYIMPIEMSKEFVRTKNKAELIQNPYVRRANHTMGWVGVVEGKMKTLSKCLGREITFDEENTKKWSQRIKDNYKKNRELDAK